VEEAHAKLSGPPLSNNWAPQVAVEPPLVDAFINMQVAGVTLNVFENAVCPENEQDTATR
jgi:hypothetical protein